MASVLFSTVGQALGGPLAAAVGATIGSSVDGRLFGRGRSGAIDLFVQQSTYGEVVPRIYGRTRTAGQVIWATLPAAPGGKGSGRQAATASFAVALSAGPVADVHRIWADGREIRSVEGVFESSVTMRLHRGDLLQQADPLIMAVEGLDSCPDYRSIAYVVFEDFDLEPFGNRIPNLSFEVEADAATAREWLQDLCRKSGLRAEVSDLQSVALGVAASGDGLADAGLLADLAAVTLGYPDGKAEFHAATAVQDLLWDDLLLATDVVPEWQQDRLPSALSVSYLDPERDYQAGRQRVSRGRRGREVERQEAISTSAGMARTLAGRLLRELEASSEQLRFGLPWKWLGLAVGDLVRISGRGPWRIVEKEVRGLAIRCLAERVDGSAARPLMVSDPGRAQTMPVLPAGPTDLRLFETPVPMRAGEATLFSWMSGGPNWRGATARQLVGGNERVLGEVRALSAHGQLLQPLAPGPETAWDERNMLRLSLVPGSPVFQSRNPEDVLAGANLLLVGDEILQYCDAMVEAGGEVRLSRLLRGRFGTLISPTDVPAGTDVRELAADRLLPMTMTADAIGSELLVLAMGPGDPVGGTETTRRFEGLGFAPLAPVHLRAARRADGTIVSQWLPRSRANWEWNAVDEPPAGRWRWSFTGPATPPVAIELDDLTVELDLAAQSALAGGPFGPGTVSVTAIGEGPEALRATHVVLS